MQNMKKRDFTETLIALCRQNPEFMRFGRLNSAAIGRAVGIHQATVHRMLEGQTVEPTPVNAQKLCKYFRVSREQLSGEQPIQALEAGEYDPYLELAAALQRAKALPAKDVEMVLAVIDGAMLRLGREKEKR
jgi:DNA-binding XRE family transcriptional regulator